MRIAVILRTVPDLEEGFEIEEGIRLDRDSIATKLNDFDDQALEQAVLIKEAIAGAQVVALAPDCDGIDRLLQTAVARGADRVVAFGPLPADAPAAEIAACYAQIAGTVAADLILTGVQTDEDIAGQLAPILGQALHLPHASSITSMLVEDGQIILTQEYGGGTGAVLRLSGTAVIGVQAAASPPRYVAGSKLRQAIALGRAERLNAKTTPPARVTLLSLMPPVSAGTVEMIDGDADEVAEKIIAALSSRGLLER